MTIHPTYGSREDLIDFADWLSNQAEIDVMVVDEAVDLYLNKDKPEGINPYLPLAPADGKHVFPGGSYRCSLCGVYNRTDSPPFHEPCKGGWAESAKMRYAADDRWKAEKLVKSGKDK